MNHSDSLRNMEHQFCLHHTLLFLAIFITNLKNVIVLMGSTLASNMVLISENFV